MFQLVIYDQIKQALELGLGQLVEVKIDSNYLSIIHLKLVILMVPVSSDEDEFDYHLLRSFIYV